MSEQIELPEEVNQEIADEFGQKPEPNPKKWNDRFNALADSLQTSLASSKKGEGWIIKSPSVNDNIAVGLSKLAARSFEGSIRLVITHQQFAILVKLAELGAKATGGRRPTTIIPQKE